MMAMSNRGRRSHAREGYVLIFFVMLLFAIFGIAALVIDLGLARWTQRQMQTATDSAALEGLRGEGSMAYIDRSDRAEQVVTWTFDDDLDAGNGDDGAFDSGGAFGAGPVVGFTGGAGDLFLHASETLQVNAGATVYKPTLDRGVETPGTYTVSIRRGAATPTDANLSADGPPLPYLFARGSLLNRQLIGQGMTVRAEGISRPSRALSVGLPDATAVPPLMGLAPFCIELATWNVALVSPQSFTLVGGNIGSIGRFFAMNPGPDMPRVIASPLPVAVGVVADGSYDGYVPIYTEIAGVNRVAGYGRAVAVVVTVSGTQTVTITRMDSQVALENASSCPLWPVPLAGSDLHDLLEVNLESPLFSASLRRSP